MVVVVGYEAEKVETELAGEPKHPICLPNRATWDWPRRHDVPRADQGSRRPSCRGRRRFPHDASLFDQITTRRIRRSYQAGLPLGNPYPRGSNGTWPDCSRLRRASSSESSRRRMQTRTSVSIAEVNMSTYVFDCQKMLRALDRLTDDNNQKEYYITDLPGIMLEDGEDVRALPVLKPIESLSVNTAGATCGGRTGNEKPLDRISKRIAEGWPNQQSSARLNQFNNNSNC